MSTEIETQNVAYTFATAKAGIDRGEKGRTIQTIVERGYRKPVGRFVSLKCGIAMPWESFDELHAIWLSEADSTVERYLARPFRIWFRVEGSKAVDYFPDLERRLSDGRWEVIEVKRSRDEMSLERDYERKLAKVRQLAQVEGFHFRVMTAEEDLAGPALGNAQAITRDRFTQVTTADVEAFVTAAQRGSGAMPLAKAIEILSFHTDRFDPTARAKLHALIVRRVAGVDLSQPMKHGSAVYWIPGRKGKTR